MSRRGSQFDVSTSSPAWEEFVSAIAETTDVQRDGLVPETTLVRDLGLDSLALAELVALLVVEFGMETLAAELDDRRWGSITLGELYEEQRTGERVRPAAEFDLRLDR